MSIRKNKNEAVSASQNAHSKSTLRMFIILSIVLFALILILVAVYFLAKENVDNGPDFDVWEGEDIYGRAHMAYPVIENEDVLKIEVRNETGSFAFLPVWDEAKAKNVWRLEEYQDVAINAPSFEMLRMHVTTQTTEEPIRNATQADLVEWGVDESCKTGYTLYFKENGVEKSYTVRIGKRTNSSDGTYCAYIEGRNHIYKFAPDSCSYVTRPKLSYLSPTINTFFGSEMYTLLGIDKFEISLAKNNTLKSVVKINVTERDEAAASFLATYSKDVLGKDRTTIASTSYLNEVFSHLYISFSGTEVVAIDPDSETLKEFGLGEDDEKYLIDAEFSSNAYFADPSYKYKDPALFISRKKDDCYYVLSRYFFDDIIVKVPSESLPFLGEDSFSLTKWTDTTSITTGFFESLCKDKETGAPGLNKIIIKALKSEETGLYNEEIFNLYYDEGADTLLVKALNNPNLEFKDDKRDGVDSTDRNWFRNLYVYFLYYPFIYEFNTMSDEKIAEYEKDENIVYSITAYRNDGKVVKYTYYKIDVNFAFEKAESGTVKDDGTVVWDEPVYDYISSMTQLRKVYKAIDILLSGEKVTPDDELL